MSEINLVPSKIVGEQQKQKNINLLNVYSLIMILLTFLAAVVLFYLKISLNQDYSKWQKELRQKMERLAVYKKTEGVLSFLNQKQEVYQTYQQESFKNIDLWDKLKQKLPPAGSFQKLDIKEDGSVLLSYETESFLEAANFLVGLQNSGYQKFSLKSAGRLLGSNRILVAISFLAATPDSK